jgi:hypothetical protein
MMESAKLPITSTSKTPNLPPYLHGIRTYLQSVTDLSVEESSLLNELDLIDEVLEAAKNEPAVNDIINTRVIPSPDFVLGPKPGRCPVCGADRNS